MPNDTNDVVNKLKKLNKVNKLNKLNKPYSNRGYLLNWVLGNGMGKSL